MFLATLAEKLSVTRGEDVRVNILVGVTGKG